MGYSSGDKNSAERLPVIVEQPCGVFPGVEMFSAEYDAEDYCDWVDQSNGDPVPSPLVMYLQDATETTAPGHSRDVIRAVEQELRLQGSLFDNDRALKQLTLSGSIATDWSDDELYRLITTVQSSFYINTDSLNSWCAFTGGAIPSAERLRLLRVLGFNVLRMMPLPSAEENLPMESIAGALEQADRLGFRSTVLDMRRVQFEPNALESAMQSLLARVQPERICAPVTGERDTGVVDACLVDAGYLGFGLGWYLRAGDSWLQARTADRLSWTMLGYSELGNPDIIGVGPGALSAVSDFYGINQISLQAYAASLDDGILPIVRGVVLEDADVLRREIIAMILAAGRIEVAAIENKWGISFRHFFARESELLRTFEQNGWVRWTGDRVDILTHARRELVQICRVFDGRANPLSQAPHPGGRPAGADYTRSVHI